MTLSTDNPQKGDNLMPYKDLPEGQTHSFGDGCGCPDHNPTAVLFLDIDGVLNHLGVKDHTPARWNDKGHLLMMDQDKVFMLNLAVDRHGLGVVLSSAWRHHDDWRDQMRSNGLVFQFLDRTPLKVKNSKNRGSNIQAWLDAHPEVTRYAIIDDAADMLEQQLPNFFRTDVTVGLTPETMKAVVEHLNL